MTARTSVISPHNLSYGSSKYVPSSTTTRRRTTSTGTGLNTPYSSSYTSSYGASSSRPPAYPKSYVSTADRYLLSSPLSRHGSLPRHTTTSLRTVSSPRPLPPGRGPLDEYGRKIPISDVISLNKTSSTISTRPLKAYGSSNTSTSTYTTTRTFSPSSSGRDAAGPPPGGRSRRSGSVSDICATFENLSTSHLGAASSTLTGATSTLGRSKKYGSHADLAGVSSSSSTSTPRTVTLSGTSGTSTPERSELLYDTGSKHVARNYYNTTSHMYDYSNKDKNESSSNNNNNSSSPSILPDIHRTIGAGKTSTRSPSSDRVSAQRIKEPPASSSVSPPSKVRSRVTRDSDVSPTSPRKLSYASSRQNSISSMSSLNNSAGKCDVYNSSLTVVAESASEIESDSSGSSATVLTPGYSSIITPGNSTNLTPGNSIILTPRNATILTPGYSAILTPRNCPGYSSTIKHVPLSSRLSTLKHGVNNNGSTESSPSPSSSALSTRGQVGLRNLGNTCFMNSILQCLSNTRLLQEYLLQDGYRDDINKTTSNMKGALINAYAKLMKTMWKDGDGYVSPTDFKSQVQKFAPRFVGYNQQDSQEFLVYLLEGLHEDVNRVTVKKKHVIKDEDGEEKISASEKARETWKRYLSRDNSRIVDIFVGQLKSCLKCTTCGYASNTFDPIWQLSLPIKKRGYGQDVSLQDCLELFTQEEILDGDEKPTCARCKARRKCTKSFSIQKFPKVLVIHLKRFNHESLYRSKLSTTVDFPLNDLDLTPYSAEKGSSPIVYNLFAVSNHSGTPLSGHYTAVAKHPHSGEWHSFNDQRVSSISSSRVRGSEAYVLFYELCNQSAHL